MNISQFVFFDSSSTEQTSNSFGNVNQGSAMTLEVRSLTGSTPDISLTVEGVADLNSVTDYFPLRIVSLETFKTVKKITKVGLYMVIIDGVGLVRLQCADATSLGTFKAYAVSIS